jgi:hypothetical protein
LRQWQEFSKEYFLKSRTYEVNDRSFVEEANEIWSMISNTCSTVCTVDLLSKYGFFYEKEKCVYGEDAYLMLKVLLNEKVLISLFPQVIIHKEHSELSSNNEGTRPIPPYLLQPDEIIAAACK